MTKEQKYIRQIIEKNKERNMTLEDKIQEIIDSLEALYKENHDIRDEPEIVNLKIAILYLKKSIGG